MLAEHQNKEARRDARKEAGGGCDRTLKEGRDNGMELQKERQDSTGNSREFQ